MKLLRVEESETNLVFKSTGTLAIHTYVVSSMIKNSNVQKYKAFYRNYIIDGQKELAVTNKYMLLKTTKLANE